MIPRDWQRAKARLQEAASAMPSRFRIQGLGTKSAWTTPPRSEAWQLPVEDEPLVAFSPEDQVAIAWASAPLDRVREEVEAKGLTLPIPRTGHRLLDGVPGTVGGWCAMSLPHCLWSQCMAPRESVLGMGVILSDGTVAKSGAAVVKSVAGYDVHRFLCGSRGDLAVIGLVMLRLLPLRALPVPSAQAAREWKGESVWIQRTLRADFDEARARAEGLVAWDEEGCFLWTSQPPRRLAEDWVIGPEGALDPAPLAPAAAARIKASFDPQGRLEGGGRWTK